MSAEQLHRLKVAAIAGVNGFLVGFLFFIKPEDFLLWLAVWCFSTSSVIDVVKKGPEQ